MEVHHIELDYSHTIGMSFDEADMAYSNTGLIQTPGIWFDILLQQTLPMKSILVINTRAH